MFAHLESLSAMWMNGHVKWLYFPCYLRSMCETKLYAERFACMKPFGNNKEQREVY